MKVDKKEGMLIIGNYKIKKRVINDLTKTIKCDTIILVKGE